MADAYSKIGWENSPSEKTPINMTNLNHMDEGIEKNRELISQLEGQIKNQTGSGTGAGWNTTQINLLENIGQYLLFSDAKTGQLLFDSLITSLRNSASGGGESEEPENPDATLTSISATYTGGEVTAGTALSALTGITVTGTWSDGSTTNITGYALSGEIVEGENTITVTYEGLTTTFTVTGIAESGGDTPVTYTITNSLTNVSTSNATETIESGKSYTATLTADAKYAIDESSIAVTMGGINITSTVYANGVITIAEVTGNIIVVASATSTVLYSLAEPLTFDGTQTELVDTGVNLAQDSAVIFSLFIDLTSTLTSQGTGEVSAIHMNASDVEGYESSNNAINLYTVGRGSWNATGWMWVSANYTNVISDSLDSAKVIIVKKPESAWGAGDGYYKYYKVVDGAVTSTDVSTNSITYGTANTLVIGGRKLTSGTIDRLFVGTINQLEIYNKALSDTEIAALLGV